MLPKIETPFGTLYPYTFMAVVGAVMFLAVLHIELKGCRRYAEEESIVFPAVALSGLVAIVTASLLDALFKVCDNGALVISGSTFYGGLFGGCACMYVILGRYEEKSSFSRREWFDLLTIPLIVFHICGRIGCFLAGCCYGVETDGPLGVVFPDNPETGVYHNGVACYPTQLFEVATLVLIALVVVRASRRFETYLLCYAISRFFIEFLRGDYRGFTIGILSPAQVVSLLIVVTIVSLKLRRLFFEHTKAIEVKTIQ